MRTTKIFIALILIFLAAGCGEPKVTDEAPKKVVDTYLEGFRDKNPEKVYKSVSYEVYKDMMFPPQKLQRTFAEQNKKVGQITGWQYIGESYIDEVNNQAILQLMVKTTKSSLLYEVDLRKTGDYWYILSIKQKKHN